MVCGWRRRRVKQYSDLNDRSALTLPTIQMIKVVRDMRFEKASQNRGDHFSIFSKQVCFSKSTRGSRGNNI